MGKIYKITQQEKENKIRNLDEIFLNDIEKKKSKTYIFSFLIPILSAVLIAGCIFVSVKFGFFVDKGFPWILLLWAISVLVITAVSISYGKSTKIYKKYEDALIRYEKFSKSPEKFIYKSLDEFDLNDFSQRTLQVDLKNQKWTLIVGEKTEDSDSAKKENLQITEHNKFAIANEISVILDKNREILEKAVNSNGKNFYEVYKIYARYNEFCKFETYKRALKEINEMLNHIDKTKFKAVFEKE